MNDAMMKRRAARPFAFMTLIFLLGFLPMPDAHSESLREMWYMNRGRENKSIKNYKAAIEAFEKAVELNPNNREAARELGMAYESQGAVDKAVSQNDAYLAKWPNDPETALRQARLLKWGRYSYRQKDALKYYEISLRHRDDAQVRLEYADALAAEKQTSSRAIPQYQAVLRKEPKRAAAHRGLAQAYAWNGDQDQALYHSKLATQYGDKSSDLKKLEANLGKDRRPEAGAEALLLNQSSSQEFDLSGVRAGVYGRFDVTPFLSMSPRAGAESFWNQNQSESGAYLGLGGQYRFSRERSISGDFVYHSLSNDGLEFTARYSWVSEEGDMAVGVKRELVYDSYLSLVGSKLNSVEIGQARRNFVFGEWSQEAATFSFNLTPYAGHVSAASVTPNFIIGVNALVIWGLSPEIKNGWSLVARSEVMSYQKDHSGFQQQSSEPLAGGYFSPELFLNQEALVRYQKTVSDSDLWMIEGGPSYQFIRGTNSDGSKLGGHASFQYITALSTTSFISTQIEARRVADVFTQVRAMGWLTYKF